MTVEVEKVWQLPPAVMCSMFPIMSFIIPNMSMKPPDIPSIPKEEAAREAEELKPASRTAISDPAVL